MPIVTFERRRPEEFAPTIEGAETVNLFNDEPSAHWRHMFRSTACARRNCLCTNGSPRGNRQLRPTEIRLRLVRDLHPTRRPLVGEAVNRRSSGEGAMDVVEANAWTAS